MVMARLALFLLPLLAVHVQSLSPPTSLRFGYDTGSYMMLELDMEPVKDAISVCSWINKKTADSVHDAWFTYNAPSRIHEILLAGRIRGTAYMNKDNIGNSQAVPSNEWHHVCITWGHETKTRGTIF